MFQCSGGLREALSEPRPGGLREALSISVNQHCTTSVSQYTEMYMTIPNNMKTAV